MLNLKHERATEPEAQAFRLFFAGVTMWRFYNPNPNGKRVGDCTIRAITKATGKEWAEVYAAVSVFGYAAADMPSANHVWGAYLKRQGYRRYLVDDHGQDIYTVADFCRDNPRGTYLLAISGHVVCAVDGDYYDTWDSGDEIPEYYWIKEE